MSNLVTGVVEIISEKPRGNGIAYGIKMSDGVWYGHGFIKPKFVKGDDLTFSWVPNGNFKNIEVNTVQVGQANKPQQAQASGGAPAPHNPNATNLYPVPVFT